MLASLADVLVVTVRKSFWASPEAERWPRRLYARVVYGHSTNLANSLLVFARALMSIWFRRPRLVLLGSVERTVPWFVQARRAGLLRGAKLVVTNQLQLTAEQLEQVDGVIVYARVQADALGKKGLFMPLPADGDFDAARRAAEPGDYVFAGGGAGRDFQTLIEAVRDIDATVEIVTFAPTALGRVPANVRVQGPMSQDRFLARMAGAQLVVVPVESAASPHGQTTLVQALALGKPVVATRSAGVVDYVLDGEEGILVAAGDVGGYKAAIDRLASDTALRDAVAARAAARGEELSYRAFADALTAACRRLLS